MKRIKFIYEYQCWPLWHMDYEIDGEMGNIDPTILPISMQLINQLDEWSKAYDEMFVSNESSDKAFKNFKSFEAFLEKGVVLAKMLQCELGNEFQIIVAYDEKGLI